jgi:hypothetical protein
MILHPERYEDQGCWISDDRVYAFVSAAHHCIGEIGYHGTQPVSRNSRVLVGQPAVLGLFGCQHNGMFLPVVFETFDWFAAGVQIKGRCGKSVVNLEIAVSGHSFLVAVSSVDSTLEMLSVKFHRSSLFSNVHGERIWSDGTTASGSWRGSFRDRIQLNEWLKRTGPYAGDFLLPEPLRRRIFNRPLRSGLATIDDVRPEFRDAPLSVYDAEVSVQTGGSGYLLREERESLVFTASLQAKEGNFPPFGVFFEDQERHGEPASPLQTMADTGVHYRSLLQQAPKIAHTGHPHSEEFFSTAPALVESCTIRDYGIPRATPGRYYWIWAWDAMVTSFAVARWGTSRIADTTVSFINTHRDGDEIPMRWTHTLEPLDTQPRGALEGLLASLAYTNAIETGNYDCLKNLYPRLTEHLRHTVAAAGPRGLFPNIGFYPDLPLDFGRTEASAVALEVGCFYSFCRTMENVARLIGDQETAATALKTASLLEKTFSESFWDDGAGFLLDAIDLSTTRANRKHPLFSFLYLHSTLGWSLMREKIDRCADFISRQLLSEEGIRVLPANERSSELISNAWYPHWDLYALKILRRAGRSREILLWLKSAEKLLAKLGFCPEYYTWTDGTPHCGAPSNLNCVTGWYQAFLEGVLGLETDPGGLTIIPLGLPLGEISLGGIWYHGTKWTVTVRNGGALLQSVEVDGKKLVGSLKIPRHDVDGKEHRLLLTYGKEEQEALFREIINAQVLESRAGKNFVEVNVRALGRTDVVFTAPGSWRLMVDDAPVHDVRPLPGEKHEARLPILGEHLLRLTG